MTENGYGRDSQNTGNGAQPSKEYVPGSYSQPTNTDSSSYTNPQSGNWSNNGASPVNGYGYGTYNAVPVNAPGRGLGISALVLGILALLTCWFGLGAVFGLVGLILGIIALVKLKKTPASKKGMAITGTILSALGLIIGAVMAFFILVISSLAVEGAESCQTYLNSGDQVGYERCINDWAGDKFGTDTQNSSQEDA